MEGKSMESKDRKGKDERNDGVLQDADCDWNYLRTNLDSPKSHLAQRLGMELAGWIRRNWPPSAASVPRLALIARIPLGPRQAVALVEAEGMHLLVATSADGAASFFPLHPATRSNAVESTVEAIRGAIVAAEPNSWSRNRLLSPGLAPGGRNGRRWGVQGRVSW